MMWLCLVCVRLLHNHKHRLIELIIFFKIHNGQIKIDGEPSFLEHFLEYQTNFYLIAWFHKVIGLS